MDEHLNTNQIEALLQSGRKADTGANDNGKMERAARTHLESCEECRQRLSLQEWAMERLAFLKSSAPDARGPQCPPDDVWIEITAGVESKESETYLSHAIQCDHCGPLLQMAAADLSDELTPAEEIRIASLHSSTPRAQKELAAKLRHSRATDETSAQRHWFWVYMGPVRLAAAAAVVILTAASTWFALRPTPEKLIAEAYHEKRTIQLRIEGAPPTQLQQVRGNDGENDSDRPALLHTKEAIALELRKHPEDVRWLQARGRACLLEGKPDNAIKVLETAKRINPNNQSVLIDLASAYLLSAEMGGNTLKSGDAVNLLKQVLVVEPGNEVAEFNLALALEKSGEPLMAIATWTDFLSNHANSGWAPEARDNLSRLQKQEHQQSLLSGEPLKPVPVVAAAFEHHDAALISSIDDRIEDYAREAVQQWLPEYSGSGGVESDLQTALAGVAGLMRDRHGDRWLADALSSPRLGTEGVRRALFLMAGAERHIQSAEDQLARQDLLQAKELFVQGQVETGVLRTDFNLVQIEQFGGRRQPCEEQAIALAKKTALRTYSWLRAQVELEQAGCLEDSDRRAQSMASDVRATAEKLSFPVLALRAMNFESGIANARGDAKTAWAVSVDGLTRYWRGAFPAVTGYGFLFNLQEIAEQRQESFLEAEILREANAVLATSPNIGWRAFEEERLGRALLACMDLRGSSEAFHSAQDLFTQIPEGPHKDELIAESELGLAEVDIQGAEYQAASTRLEKSRATIGRLTNVDMERVFYITAGAAELHLGYLDQADSDLRTALLKVSGERALATSETDRLKWSHENEAAFRAMVELQLKTDPNKAWWYWESFKGEALGLENTEPPAHGPAFSGAGLLQATLAHELNAAGNTTNANVVSYCVFAEGIALWVWDGRELHHLWIAIKQQELEARVKRFVGYCSDPDSNPELLRRDGWALYRLLIEPVEPWLGNGSRLIFEQDGALRSLPMEALIDSQGRYLSDRFDISVSPGVEYLRHARRWTGVNADSRALVIGNPRSEGWLPLPEAEQEARAVAELFRNPTLVVNEPLTEGQFNLDMAHASVLHFSGHGVSTGSSTGLILGTNSVLGSWKKVSTREQPSELVVLSSCTSSRGTTGYFDDEDSMVREIVSAGVPNVVASGWMVDSAATRHLMLDFYAELFSGHSVSASLANAERSLRLQPEYSHPFYWAGFSVFGRG